MGLFLTAISVICALIIVNKLYLSSLNKSFIKKHRGCKYVHAYRGSGIAVDVDARKVSLFNKKNEVSYDYEDVREWSYKIETAGRIYGGGVAVMQANTANAAAAIKNTGFFVKVRDIENPVWIIKFPHNRKIKSQLERWLEIFNQAVGENRT